MSNPAFWQMFYNYGKAAGAKFPELVAAQAALESGWGEHLSGKNNYFGIKGSPGIVVKTREVIDGKEVFIHDEFKDFASVQECVNHLVTQWYKDYKGYKGVNRASTAQEAAMLLQEEGYATDTYYSEFLINLMEDNQADLEAPDGYFLPRAAEYYQAEPHQIKAWQFLEDNLDAEFLEAFKTAYKGPQQPQKPVKDKFPLDVPYFTQLDSEVWGQAERSCFSSAMAMALLYMDPEGFGGDDDWWLREVLKRGDTVSSVAQVQTAHDFGYDVEFRMDGTEQDLLDQLDKGIPIPIGILHKGYVDNPTGGGHYIVLTGYDETHFWVNDPFGDLDLINGGYPWNGRGEGEQLRYSRKNTLKRWLLDGSGADGWWCRLL